MFAGPQRLTCHGVAQVGASMPEVLNLPQVRTGRAASDRIRLNSCKRS